MKKKIYLLIIYILVFWVVTSFFSGIVVNEGLLGYLVCGGIYGLVMIYAVPLIKFFTLPVKFISVLMVSIMLSIIVFFVLNFAIPYIDFTDGMVVGLSNRFFEFPEVELNMIGNVLIGGIVAGLLSTFIRILEKGE